MGRQGIAIVAESDILTAVVVVPVLIVLALVLYSLVRSRTRRYPARELGFAGLAGSDMLFHDLVAAPYLAATPRYRLDNIFHQAGPGCHIYSYDVFPSGSRACLSSLALVDDRLDLPRFSIARAAGEASGRATGLGPRVLAGVCAPAQATPIAFPDDPAFGAAYLVTGSNAAPVTAVLAPQAVAWLAALRDAPGMADIAISAGGPLLVWSWDAAAFAAPDPTANLQTSLERLLKLQDLLLSTLHAVRG